MVRRKKLNVFELIKIVFVSRVVERIMYLTSIKFSIELGFASLNTTKAFLGLLKTLIHCSS